VRALAAAGAQAFVANSFSKNFSLYGERVGGLSVVCNDAATAANVLGQLKATVRRNYSSPPTRARAWCSRCWQSPELSAVVGAGAGADARPHRRHARPAARRAA
jgi:aromatic-amino-acid transaminase